ncbi:hypothetical protein M431DRAFT_489250 [Trichoderma harzianum CBS 226.95]|uniref:Uncharacterized protein n=1 Tax=Trichoderma harzianum CBS 226.95 TaxID=983964 RepID=A0A2T4ATU1_TRIHA|nr:hypothetical protein M431DRAFT_489250 [Trichoderma harzianum CBS 226.95]PTB60483.1 hypothetical protein M431DRAFT_489250 [Trichoderma harzianum CBS 226.95]
MRLAVSMCALPHISCLCSCPASFIIASIHVIILACPLQARISLRPSSDRSRPSRFPSTHKQARSSRGLATERGLEAPTDEPGGYQGAAGSSRGEDKCNLAACCMVLKGL